MYEKELQRILNASQNNALTFFVGAGVSALSGAPTWKALIHAISDKLGRTRKNEYSSDENLQIPQMFYYSLGENKEEYYRFVKEQLYSASLLPNTIHREMLNLNPVSFITTNYDTLLEDAAVQYCQSFKVVSQDEDVPTIFGDRFILKLHGDFKHNNFVLKEEDYLNYSENFKLIETLVKSIFSTNTVVFIGYSLNDYNIKLILNWTKTLLKGSFREPIFLYVGSSALTDTELIYQQSKGLTVVERNKLITSTDDYLDRYNAIFAALKNQSKLSLEGKSEDEAFEILYNLLQPLDRLNALRIEDVSKRLYPYIRIRDDGVIGLSQRDDLLLKRFFAINLMPDSQQNLAAHGSHLVDLRVHPDDIVLNILRGLQMLLTDQRHLIGVPIQFAAGLTAFCRERLLILLFVHRSDTEHDGNTPEEADITGHAGSFEIKIPLAVIHFRRRVCSCVFLCVGLHKLEIFPCYPVVPLVIYQPVLNAFLAVLIAKPEGTDAFL